MRFWLLGIALLLSGCAEPATTDGVVPLPLEPEEEVPETPSEPRMEEESFTIDGTTGTSAVVCEGTLQLCTSQSVSPGHFGLVRDFVVANLTAVSLTVNWTSEHLLHDELVVGVMAMGPNGTSLGEFRGTSPLVVNLTDVHLVLDMERALHIYVYNPSGFIHQPPVVAHVNVDQSYSLSGKYTLQLPA